MVTERELSEFFAEGGTDYVCTQPLHGFVVGQTADGKNDVKVMPHDTNYLYRFQSGWRGTYAPIPNFSDLSRIVANPMDIPCGHCLECRLNKSREWAARMMLEAQYHDQNWFLTLTYDDEHAPTRFYSDPDTGEALPSLSLQKKDFQDFMKRLRDHCSRLSGSPQIRFYGVGEYGEETHRPHYHIVVFGLPLDEKDLDFLKTSSLGFPYYVSKLVESCWPFGFSMVCAVTWESCAYVARYCTKKLGGDYNEFYDAFNIDPEFSLMSRKPGIARQYYEEHKDDIYRFDEIHLATADGGRTVRPSHYYDQLFDIEDPELLAKVKARRIRYALASERQRGRTTTLTKDERLQARADLITKKARALVRKEI